MTDFSGVNVQSSVIYVAQLCLSSILSGKLPPGDVITLLISKLLGFAILAGACITKLPQIIAVLKAKSAEGLSSTAYELEVVGYLVHATYGFVRQLPINTYGESVALILQDIVLLYLVYKYARLPAVRGLALFSLLVGAVGVILSGRVSMGLAQTLFDLNNLIFISARVPQIWKSFRDKSTGQLSLVTSLINVVGAIIRIFTSIKEGAGSAMVRSFVLGGALNSTIVAQILWYGYGPGKKAKMTQEKKKK